MDGCPFQEDPNVTQDRGTFRRRFTSSDHEMRVSIKELATGIEHSATTDGLGIGSAGKRHPE
jgi:hypothetical protein